MGAARQGDGLIANPATAAACAKPGRWLPSLIAAMLALVPSISPAQSADPDDQTHLITLEDLFARETVMQVAPSPDGELLAIVVQRPVTDGEVYGRTLYEMDPARADLWLYDMAQGQIRRLTDGHPNAAGYWCPVWSPDSRQIALLSTRPEGQEPAGGDNVRLYHWNRADDAMTRLSPLGAMSATMAGTAAYRADFRRADDSSAIRCSDEETAPFAWIDDQRLIAALLPAGKVAGLIDEHQRPFREQSQTYQAVRTGREPTISVMQSGPEVANPSPITALLAVLKPADTRTTELVQFSPYPFAGHVSVRLSPDGENFAMMFSEALIPPSVLPPEQRHDDGWFVRNRLGAGSLSATQAFRWIENSDDRALPLDLGEWSPGGSEILFRARPEVAQTGVDRAFTAALFTLSSDGKTTKQISPLNAEAGDDSVGSSRWTNTYATWASDDSVMLWLKGSDRTPGWYMADKEGRIVHTPLLGDSPARFARIRNKLGGSDFYALADGQLLMLSPFGQFQSVIAIAGYDLRGKSDDGFFILSGSSAGEQAAFFQTGNPGSVEWRDLPKETRGTWFSPAARMVLSLQMRADGSSVIGTDLQSGAQRVVLASNHHLEHVAWGELRHFDYVSSAGTNLRAAAILPPPSIDPATAPVLVWVYPTSIVWNDDSYFTDRWQPGFYNLYLYAAAGYTVLIPSIPRPASTKDGAMLLELPGKVLPALDRLEELGLGDASRAAVFGQSFGGYGVLGLVGQTDRFRAAVSVAPMNDLISMYGTFDPTSRGFGAITHQKSANAVILEGPPTNMDGPPHELADHYWANSPQRLIGQVSTPLLMLHGELDARGAPDQSTQAFFSLYRRGAEAKLVLFWGENHAISQSPANVREAINQTLDWFNQKLR